uniref:Putative secreted protein n=1 Tax=Anopheles darlingi TaxID=43151 RepID=A0A2M4D637_ANODA
MHDFVSWFFVFAVCIFVATLRWAIAFAIHGIAYRAICMPSAQKKNRTKERRSDRCDLQKQQQDDKAVRR